MIKVRKTIASTFGIILWFAVILMFTLTLQARTSSALVTASQFFGYFTILTNLLAAIYFVCQALGEKRSYRPGHLSALTVYIVLLGIIYQIVLRPLWSPIGLNRLADELLHTVNPLLVLIYWIAFEDKRQVHYRNIPFWSIYPTAYLLYMLIRGQLTGFYPYPFADVHHIGWLHTIRNCIIIVFAFVAMSFFLVWLGRRIMRNSTP